VRLGMSNEMSKASLLAEMRKASGEQFTHETVTHAVAYGTRRSQAASMCSQRKHGTLRVVLQIC